MPLLALLALLAGAPLAEICEALNVTVSPGPRTQHLIGDNVTLFCHVSQKRRRENLLAVRWVFALPSAQEYLMIKMTKFGVVQYYGNYTSRFYKRRLHLLEEKHRMMYTFLILNIQQAEQGHYICKVQEISKQRNKWTSWSNGSASTEVQVFPSHFLDEEKHNAWAFFEDFSLYAVLMCSAGILSILLFTLVILCQILSNKKRSHVKRTLVKSPQKSLQDAGSPSKTAGSPGPPTQRKGTKASEAPPAIPAKAPISHTFSKPKLLKPQRKVTLEEEFKPLMEYSKEKCERCCPKSLSQQLPSISEEELGRPTCFRCRAMAPVVVLQRSQTQTTQLLPDVMRLLGVGDTAQRQSPQSAGASRTVIFLSDPESARQQVKSLNPQQNVLFHSGGSKILSFSTAKIPFSVHTI